MRTTALANAAILAGVAAAQLRLPVALRHAHPSPHRRRELSAELAGGSLRYSVNVSVGTPPQEVPLFLSLGSHTTWVPGAGPCRELDVCPGGSFDPSTSSSYDGSDFGSFSLHHGYDTSVTGREFEDTIRVGDTEVRAFPMGIAMHGEFTQGELSIGPAAEDEYSLVRKLVDAGAASSASYSFWLNEDATSGNLLFGAVDTSAFDAPLKRISTRPDESAYDGFPVDFSSLNYTRSPGGEPEIMAPQNDLPLIPIRPVDMLTNLPRALAEEIWDLAGATYNELSGFATVPCSGGTSEASELILGLGVHGDATVGVSFDDLIIPHGMVPISPRSDEETCVFAIQSMDANGELSNDEEGPWNLGGIVLRNTYMAFDLVHHEVAFAPVRLADSESQAGDAVPSPSYRAELRRSEDADRSCPSELRTCDSSYHDDHRPRSLSVAGIALMVLGLLLILAGFITLLWFLWYRGYCCWRGRRKEKEAAPPPQSGPISEKVVYAGALPAPLPPRPTQAYTPGPASGQPPAGCAWVPTMVQYAAPLASFAPPPAETRSVPTGPPPAGPPASTLEAHNPVDPPTGRPASASPSPPAGPSASLDTPAGTTPATEDESPKPSEMGNRAPGGRH